MTIWEDRDDTLSVRGLGCEPGLGVSAGVYGNWAKVQGKFVDCLFRPASFTIAASYAGEQVGLTHWCGSRCLMFRGDNLIPCNDG